MDAQRILVVDDVVSVRITIAEMLRICGFDVREAGDGVEAVMLAQAASFDLVVSDIHLPGMDGFAVIQAVRALQPAIRGIAITGCPDFDAEKIAQAAGFAVLLRKPFTFPALRAAVNAVLQSP